MKIKSLLILLVSLTVQWSLGQKISKVDFDSIKLKIADSTSAYYYPILTERFIKADTTLTAQEYECIYYGSVFLDNYKPYSTSDNEDKFMELYKEKKYKEAISFGQKVLEENPVNLKITFKMCVCYNVLEDKQTAKFYSKRYFPLLNVIYESGDGQSVNTAFVVIKVADEYEVLADMELQMTKQSLLNGDNGEVDKLTINTNNQTEEPKITALYFNVSKLFDYLQKEFKDAKK